MKIKFIDINEDEIIINLPKTEKLAPNDISSVNKEDIISVEIPEGIYYITDATFSGFKNLKNVTLPSTLKHICEDAFQGCGFETIKIPSSVSYIAKYAFSNCTNLEFIDLSKTKIMCLFEGVFMANTKLKTILLPPQLLEIEMRAFFGCRSLTDITIPDVVNKIGSYAFFNCTSLKNIILPESVYSVGEKAFKDTLYYNTKNNWEEGYLKIGNVIIETSPLTCPSILTLHDKIVIADYAFQENDSVNEIHFAGKDFYAGKGSFGNSSIKSMIIIAENKVTLGSYAFENSLLDCITIKGEEITLHEKFCNATFTMSVMVLECNSLVLQDEALVNVTIDELHIQSNNELHLCIDRESVKNIEINNFHIKDNCVSDTFCIPSDDVFFDVVNSLVPTLF